MLRKETRGEWINSWKPNPNSYELFWYCTDYTLISWSMKVSLVCTDKNGFANKGPNDQII